MKQQDIGLNLSTRRTRKEVLLDEMALVMQWADLVALIAPHEPVAKIGRPPFDLEMILRITACSNGSVCLIWRQKKPCLKCRFTVTLWD